MWKMGGLGGYVLMWGGVGLMVGEVVGEDVE